MAKRISGLVMIVNTLMPIIISLVLAVAGYLFWDLFAERLREPVQHMTRSLDATTEIKKTVAAVKKLSPLADIFDEYKNKFNELAQQTQTVVNIFSELGGSISFLLKILVIFLLPWLALTYGVWGYRRLSMGWSLLQGRG
jgi:ABC-type bacteriocin/lantibiotic exporter with double-glycine peptidase domain